MSIDAFSVDMVDLIGQVGGKTVTGNAFYAGAKMLAANGGMSEAWAAIEENRWSDLVDVGIKLGVDILVNVDPILKPFAPAIAAIIIYARHHPADAAISRAMLQADGQGGSPSTSNFSF